MMTQAHRTITFKNDWIMNTKTLPEQGYVLEAMGVPSKKVPRLARPGSPLLGFGSENDSYIDLDAPALIRSGGKGHWSELLTPISCDPKICPTNAKTWQETESSVITCGDNGEETFGVFRRAAVLNFEGAYKTERSNFVRFCHGWYVFGNLTPIGLLRAICAVIPSDGVIAAETAAMLYGIRVQSPSYSFGAPRICVVRPSGKRALQRPGIHCRVMELDPQDVVRKAGVRCTSPLRTLVDLAMVSTLEVATHLVERFIIAGLVKTADLWDRISSLRGRRGIRVLRQAVELADPKSESPLETAVRIRLFEAGLPKPESQIPVWVPNVERPYRLDMGWLKAPNGKRVGVEVHSKLYHPTEGLKAEQDLAREARIGAQGWQLVIVRTDDLRGDSYTFENQIANKIGCRTPRQERRKWHRNRWMMKRNAWTRPVAGTWRVYNEEKVNGK